PFIEEGASISVSYFQICKYDPATNEVTVVDQLGANNTIGSYDVNLFDGGYAVVAAMFNEGKEYEELAFSNLTDFLVGIEENEGQPCRVYPNPAKDRFIVEGSGSMTITNALGQTLLTREIDGKTTIELPQGLYFVKLGETMRKVVVE
ncbi:MAG: T9SS type A sorting domain-containing protein, partial [Bacteroidales bacterium]|nr:T9SS type A sorting domain-containing protein [Bacteroidales bacterium]